MVFAFPVDELEVPRFKLLIVLLWNVACSPNVQPGDPCSDCLHDANCCMASEQARVNHSTVLVLTSFATLYVINSELPKTDSLTSIDKIIVSTVLFPSDLS